MADQKDTNSTTDTPEQEYDVDSTGESLFTDALAGFDDKPDDAADESAATPDDKATETPDEPASKPADAVDTRKDKQDSVAGRVFDDGHYGLGRMLGLSPEAVRANYGTPEAFELAVAGAVQKPSGENAPVKPVEDTPGFELKLDNEEDLAPEIVTAMKSMADHFNKTVSAMSKRNQELERRVQQSASLSEKHETMTVVQRFDAIVEKLGSEWEPAFGKGGSLEMDENSDTGRNRSKLAETAAALKQAYATMPTPRNIDLEEAVQMALRASFNKPEARITEPDKKAVQSAADRNGSLAPRPAVRRTTEPVGIGAAASRIDQWKQANGMASDTDDDLEP